MKTNIVLATITKVPNYGAALQAYASKKVLENFGAVTILEHDNPVLRRARSWVRIGSNARSVMSAGKDLMRMRSRSQLLSKFKAFYDHDLGLNQSQTPAQLRERETEIDVCVSGSDQIWNPLCVSDDGTFDEAYFLNFAPYGSKRISFSSSMGGYQCNKNMRGRLAELLNGYDAISVREHDTKIFLEELLAKPVRHSLDPTLHLTSDQWAELIPKNWSLDKPGDFILTYAVPRLKILNDVTKRISSHLKLPVVSIDSDPFPLIDTPYRIRNAGPVEFLDLFRSARFVTTDSFHGVCFSIIHKIPFVAVTSGPHANRIKSLLIRLGLEERCLNDKDDILRAQRPIDYTSVHSILNSERNADLNFLETSMLFEQ